MQQAARCRTHDAWAATRSRKRNGQNSSSRTGPSFRRPLLRACYARGQDSCSRQPSRRPHHRRSHRNASGGRRDQGRARASMTHSTGSLASSDTPLIGELVATSGRSATEGGGERAVMKRASIQFKHQAGEPRRTAGASSRLAQPFYGQVQEPRFLLPT
jgi:hypothetical protein